MDTSRSGLARRTLIAMAGALLLGTGGAAQASHDRDFEIEINTPNLSTRYASSPRYYDHYHYDRDWRGYPPHRARGYYVPGYWQWQPPRYYGPQWRDDRAYRHDHGKHRGWDNRKNRHWKEGRDDWRHDHRHDDRRGHR